MGGDVRVGVERVDHVEHARACGRLLGQVVRAAAAQDEHVHVGLMGLHIGGGEHRHALGQRLHRRRVATREQRHQFQIVVLPAGQLHTAPQVAVSEYADARFRHVRSSP